MSLPSGYKRLEYIQSSGTQYIDTGFKHNQNTRVVMHVKPVSITANAWAFEGRTSSDCRKGVFFYYSSGSLWNADYYDSNYRKSFSGISSTADLNIDYDKNTCTVNGVSVNFTAKTFQSTFNLTLLACNTGGSVAGYLSAKLYSCQIYDNSALIRDYIPCQTTAGEVGLWDNVNSVFYGNAGTGTFTAGPVIAIAADESKITKLEYIESSGTQYVDTGFTANQNTSATIKFSTTQQSNGGILVAMQGWKNRGFGIFVNAIIFGSSTTARTGMFGDGNIHEVTLTSAKCYDNGSLIWSGTASTFTTPATLTICKSNVVSEPHEFSSAKIYSCQIYDNGTLVREYIAAKLADGTVGLYDKLNGLLYINAGTGTFEAGPEVGVDTPENFRLSSSTANTATLAWDAVDGATGYKLYRDGILIATLTDTSYTDTIQPFTSYIYTLTAYNDSGESDPATISVQVIIPPETPSNFRASSASMTAIALAWDAVTEAESYQLSRDGAVIYTGEYPSYTDRGLTAETAYTYTLSSVNTAGSSAETTLEATTTQLILVTDRTAADVAAQNAKGTYTAADLYRVGEAMNYVADRLRAAGYDPHISPKTDWKDDDWVDPASQDVYLGDLAELRKQFAMMKSTPEVPPRILATGMNTNDGLTHTWANDIERILEDVDALITNIMAGWFYSGELYAGEV